MKRRLISHSERAISKLFSARGPEYTVYVNKSAYYATGTT
jgi:hypothetical protein